MKTSIDTVLTQYHEEQVELELEAQKKEQEKLDRLIREEREKAEVLALLNTLRDSETDRIIKSYNGKVGCMCGCLGTYSEMEFTNRSRINSIIANIELGEDFTYSSALGGEEYVYSENGNGKCTAVYFNKK